MITIKQWQNIGKPSGYKNQLYFTIPRKLLIFWWLSFWALFLKCRLFRGLDCWAACKNQGRGGGWGWGHVFGGRADVVGWHWWGCLQSDSDPPMAFLFLVRPKAQAHHPSPSILWDRAVKATSSVAFSRQTLAPLNSPFPSTPLACHLLSQTSRGLLCLPWTVPGILPTHLTSLSHRMQHVSACTGDFLGLPHFPTWMLLLNWLNPQKTNMCWSIEK